jgi:diphthamide biosynthesis enzyme Dph1/Dph2-like protein
LTRNKQLPVYFLYENLFFSQEKENNLKQILQEIVTPLSTEDSINNICYSFLFYHHKYTDIIERIKSDFSLENKLKISLIPYQPDMYVNELNQQEDLLNYSRIFKKINLISKNDKIYYLGSENDKLLSEICLRYINFNKIFLIKEEENQIDSQDKENKFTINEMTSKSVNSLYIKRFNLIQKAKESEIFGIIVGSLSIGNLNQILDELKKTISKNNKKFYTFLLGKITLEKLSNFVEFIDCFVLLACPFSDFYNFKTLMKPMVSPLDVEMALNEEVFKWDMSYTFDPSFIINKTGKIENQKENEQNEESFEKINSNFTGLKLSEDEKNRQLAKIFSVKTIQNYEKRVYKGLNLQEIKGTVEKFKIGKTGIPLKYEDIDMK